MIDDNEVAAHQNEKLYEPKFGVDLNELETRSVQGEDVNVRHEYIAAVTEEQIEYKINELKLNRKHNLTVEKVRRLIGNTHFFEVFEEVIAQSPNLDTLRWRLEAFLKRDNWGQEIYSQSNRRRVVDVRQEDVLYNSFMQLADFAAGSPDVEDEALFVWSEIVTKAAGQSHKTVASVLDRMYIRRSRNPKISEEQKQKEEAAIARYSHPLTWNKGLIEQYRDDTRIWPMLSNLELVPLEQVDIENIDAIQRYLLEDGPIKRKPGKIIAKSINITKNIIQSLAANIGNDKSKASTLLNAIEKMEQQQDGPVSPPEMINLANIITFLIRKEQKLEIPSLDAQSLGDLPKAVDRILFFAFDDEAMAHIDTSGMMDKFLGASECAKLLTIRGTQEKLDQKVLSIGDIVLRYGDRLPANEIRELIEQMQGNKRELAVDGLYRELRRRHKSKAHFGKWKPGSGVLT